MGSDFQGSFPKGLTLMILLGAWLSEESESEFVDLNALLI